MVTIRYIFECQIHYSHRTKEFSCFLMKADLFFLNRCIHPVLGSIHIIIPQTSPHQISFFDMRCLHKQLIHGASTFTDKPRDHSLRTKTFPRVFQRTIDLN